MPSHIKKNFFYKTIWSKTRGGKKQNANFLFIGDTGSGKTYSAIKWAYDLDKNFNVDRICFSLNDFLELLDKGDAHGRLNKGSCVILDEIAGSEEGADSRSFMSKSNKNFSFLATTFRIRGLIVFYCAPLKSQIDANIRRLGIRAVVQHYERNINLITKRNRVIINWRWIDPVSGKDYNPAPVIYIKGIGKAKVSLSSTPIPPKDLLLVYERKKRAFLAENIGKWKIGQEEEKAKELNVLKAYPKALKVLDMIAFKTKDNVWKIRKSLMRFELKLNSHDATVLKQKLEYDLNKGTITHEISPLNTA